MAQDLAKLRKSTEMGFLETGERTYFGVGQVDDKDRHGEVFLSQKANTNW